MTDITELAQSLKAAAVRVIKNYDSEWFEAGHQICTVHKSKINLISLANPANVLALVEALEYYKSREERVTSLVRDNSKSWDDLYRQVEAKGKRNVELVEALEKSEKTSEARREAIDRTHNMFVRERDRANAAEEALEKAQQRIAYLENNEIQEEGNQFLVVRHPGKVPVIKHPVGELEDYLRQIFKADPLATIDIVTHRYYGVGGQFVEDADEYLHEMSIKVEAK
ncbi:TPA: ead/Ea22-like family protein [Klebsiella pneumoniae]|nr:ead/Ea22-like family protein [Klebsiella pneumoniae]